jgi:hypothetical protein
MEDTQQSTDSRGEIKEGNFYIGKFLFLFLSDQMKKISKYPIPTVEVSFPLISVN